MDRKETGILGENYTARYLENNGFRILKRNFRIKGGEIDIISQKDDLIVFTEVKTRSPDPLVNGFEAITKTKQKLIIKASEEYSRRFPHDFQPRFDAAWVTVSDGKVLNIRYIENAFDASE